jgi:hypothetical protein
MGRDVSIAEVEGQDEDNENQTKDEGSESAVHSSQFASRGHYNNAQGTSHNTSAGIKSLHIKCNNSFDMKIRSLDGHVAERPEDEPMRKLS